MMGMEERPARTGLHLVRGSTGPQPGSIWRDTPAALGLHDVGPALETRSGRSTVLLVLDAPRPRASGLATVAWLARRVQARVAVTAFVERRPGVDQLDVAHIGMARRSAAEVAHHLEQQGVPATAHVLVTWPGRSPDDALGVMDDIEADLACALVPRRWWPLPQRGYAVARHLERRSGRPVAVIVDGARPRRAARDPRRPAFSVL